MIMTPYDTNYKLVRDTLKPYRPDIHAMVEATYFALWERQDPALIRDLSDEESARHSDDVWSEAQRMVKAYITRYAGQDWMEEMHW